MRIRRIMAILLMGILLLLAACGAPAAPPVAPPPVTLATPPPVTPLPAPAAPPVAPPPVTPVTPPPATPPPAPATPPATPPPVVKGPNEVWIPGREFNPSILTVPVGTTVTWTNKDGEQHTVTSATGLFDASLALGQSFSYTFTAPGTYEYNCNPHPDMTGKVVVQ